MILSKQIKFILNNSVIHEYKLWFDTMALNEIHKGFLISAYKGNNYLFQGCEFFVKKKIT